MALEFPANPADGDVYPAAPNSEYVYDDTKGAWLSLPNESAKTVTSDNAPANPKDGDQWFNTVDGTLYIYIVDVDGGQWVESQAPITANGYYSPNYIINGGFDIWQRGTSATLGSTGLTNYYTADRWATYNPTGTGTLARDTTNVPAGIQYGLRFTASAANSSCNFYHTIETLNASQLAGKTVTLSLWLSGTAGASVQVALLYSTGVDTAWTGSFTNISGPNFTITATPTRYSFTATVPANAKTLQVFVGSGTLANTNFVSFTGVQLEEGTIATTFRRNANSLQGELAACQRYYARIFAEQNNAHIGIAYKVSSTLMDMMVYLPVPMRVTPGSADWNFLGVTYYGPTQAFAANNISRPSDASTRHVAVIRNQVGSTVTDGTFVVYSESPGTAYVGFSAEL